MSVSNLPAGDKLSLKGKIFDLQRKLSLLDIEQQNTETFPFTPEITSYDLPHRTNDFVQNMTRAEEQRKEKFEHLKEMVMLETGIDCTFSPQINQKARKIKSDKPAHDRLYEKGLEYQKLRQEREKEYTKNMFQPKMESKKPRSSIGNLEVDEYLYRDAQDRVERRDIIMEEAKKESERQASERKISKRSEALVKRKYERIARKVFDHMVHAISSSTTAMTASTGGSLDESESQGSVEEVLELRHIEAVIHKIQRDHRKSQKKTSDICSTVAAELSKQKNVITAAKDPYELAERIWNLLDPAENGAIDVRGYVSVVMPVLKVRGGSVANTLMSASCVRDFESSSATAANSKSAEATLLFQFIIAIDAYLTALSHGSQNVEIIRQQKTICKVKSDRPQSSTALESPTSENSPESLGASSPAADAREAKRERVALYNRVLSEREKATKTRMEELRHSIEEETMKECTFKPAITSVAVKNGGVPFALETLQKMQQQADREDAKRIDSEGSDGRESGFSLEFTADGVSVFDRLYSQKDKVPKSIAEDKHPKLEDKGLEECTFAPQFYKPPNSSFQRGSGKASSPPPTRRIVNKHAPRRMSVAQMIDSVISSADDDDVLLPSQIRRNSTNQKPDSSLGKMLFGSAEKSPRAATSRQIEDEGNVPLPPEPKGYSASIQRMRDAIERRKQKEKEEEEFFKLKEESYAKSKKMFEEGCKPFRLRTEERQAEKAKVLGMSNDGDGFNESRNGRSLNTTSRNESYHSSKSPHRSSSPPAGVNKGGALKGHVRRGKGELKPVRLYVEIKLGGGVKPSHIAVADNDNPADLAKAFCKIYALDIVAERILTDVVQQNMIAGGIPIGGPNGMTTFDNADENGGEYDNRSVDERSEPFHENDL